jgi:hypothetical protein
MQGVDELVAAALSRVHERLSVVNE